MDFEIIGEISAIETFAITTSIREVERLRRLYGGENGPGRWRKYRGIASVLLVDGTIHTANVHWYGLCD